MKSDIARTHLVLIGGGHAHVEVIRSFGMMPERGVVMTVIARELEAPYSGMLPGLVAGHYSDDACHIDVVRLASWAGARIVHGSATQIDRERRQVHVEGRAPIGYDLVSIDVGITPELEGIAGAARHALPVKPISSFVPRWRALEAAVREADGPRRIAVVGSGAAGFELILAARHRLLEEARARGRDGAEFTFTLIGGEQLLPKHNTRARRLARDELDKQGVELVTGDPAVEVTAGHVRLASGRKVAADRVMVSTKAGPADWFATSHLPLDGSGFLAVRPSLQLIDDDDIFAVGDCATVLEHPREKAGVFAVRQGPPLTANLRRRARGEAAEPFVPQTEFLTLLSTGGKRAIAARGSLAIVGDWVWRWKDKIDQDFMRRFNELPPMAGAEARDEDMRCAGCASKVGPVALSRALDRVDGPVSAARDDAAVIDDGGDRLRLETIDFFRAVWPEPYLFGLIAANHAMSDIHAMGGTPGHALANVVLPCAEPSRVEEDLFQILAGARAVFDREGVALKGGHSSEGMEMAAGFFVSGTVPRGKIMRKSALAPGQSLVMTRPLGTGILFAALMRGRARSFAIDAALAAMQRSNGATAEVLRRFGVTAAAGVTGFGLAGHLIEMLDASRVSAEIVLDRVPLFPSVLELAEEGIASTLVPENSRLGGRLAGASARTPSSRAILFDPQTAGGLLVAIDADRASAAVAALHAAGDRSADVIGTVTAACDGSARGVLTVISDWRTTARASAPAADPAPRVKGDAHV